MVALKTVFWISAFALVYVYGIYPAALLVASIFRKKYMSIARMPYQPRLSCIIIAYNEELHIGGRIENLRQASYPSDRVEIIVVSDGSTDRTNEIITGLASDREGSRHCRVKIIVCSEHRGKTHCQNLAAAAATGDILVFTDANSRFDPQALNYLVNKFADIRVGCVCGKLTYDLTGRGQAGFAERLYWSYENQMKQRESDTGAMIGVNGAIYGLRRSAYRPLADQAMSDFILPLLLIERGYRTVYEPRAVCTEPGFYSGRASFTIKRRIVLRALSSLMSEPRFLNIRKFGLVAVKLWSHKVLRWFSWVFLLLLLLSSLSLGAEGFYYNIFFAQMLFYLAAGIDIVLAKNRVKVLPLYLALYFCLVNGAAFCACLDYLAGRRITAWQPHRHR